jgi:hypothetical protein
VANVAILRELAAGAGPWRSRMSESRWLVGIHTMGRNETQPVRAVPDRAGVCRFSSTSFMLAALRVLHFDSSRAPTAVAWIEEEPSLNPTPAHSQRRFHPPTPKQPDQEGEWVAAQGATCVAPMSNNGIHFRCHARQYS